MPRIVITQPQYKPSAAKQFNWITFRRGLNTLLQDTEIERDEMAEADNIVLVGKGVPTKRWGSALYYQAGNATGSVRGLMGFYPSGASGSRELLAITDDGYLTKQNGSTFSMIAGASWASGNNAYMAQLDNKAYIVNGQRELARYSSPTLVGFPTISIPVITGATNLSNSTGTTVKSYRVSAISQVGETLASTAFLLNNQPLDLGGTAGGTIRLTFTGMSFASGAVQGFNVYGRTAGFERFLSGVPASATNYDDNGSSVPKEFTFPPTADSTGGPKARYIKRFQDRLVYAGFDAEPSKLLVTGRVPNHEKFDVSYGGNYLKIEPDAGDGIVQIETFRDRIVAFKERSIWQVTLDTQQVGNFFVTVPNAQLITASHGCIAPRSVTAVENDIYFLTRQGVHSLGYEAGFAIDVLRSKEISVKVRPYFRNLTISQLNNAVATYFDNKYIIAFPGRSEMMVFDRERSAWTGPWSIDSTVFETFYDTDNTQKLLLARYGTAMVDDFSSAYTDDKGTAIETVMRTRSEDFGDWSLFKNIKNIFTQMRNVTGTVMVDVRIEGRTGTVLTQKSFNITPTSGNSGWGSGMWGDVLWGESDVTVGASEAIFTIRWANLNQVGRTFQIVVRTTATNSNYELVGIRGDVQPVSRGITPAQWHI